MSSAETTLGEFGFAGDDHVVPFEVAALDIRGRAVQLGPVVDAILSRHDYPEPVARLLAEAMVLTVLLGTALKFEGKFILQSRSDGPVDMLVADFSTPDALRGYARFDAARLDEAMLAGKTSPAELLGSGVLAMTIDQGAHMQRYQGVVELDGSSLEDIARVYFRQSEQIPTDVRLGVAAMLVPGGESPRMYWRAGGVLTQFMPDAPDRLRLPDLPGGNGDEGEAAGKADHAWEEATALLSTVDVSELVDPSVGTERLLFRLFHEHGVRVFQGVQIEDICSCSRQRIRSILESFSAEEIADSIEDGVIKVSCEFCSKSYQFDPADFPNEPSGDS